MTLLDRIEHFIHAAQAQGDKTTAEEVINEMTPYQLLVEISEALERAGVACNTDW